VSTSAATGIIELLEAHDLHIVSWAGRPPTTRAVERPTAAGAWRRRRGLPDARRVLLTCRMADAPTRVERSSTFSRYCSTRKCRALARNFVREKSPAFRSTRREPPRLRTDKEILRGIGLPITWRRSATAPRWGIGPAPTTTAARPQASIPRDLRARVAVSASSSATNRGATVADEAGWRRWGDHRSAPIASPYAPALQRCFSTKTRVSVIVRS